jgi:hypothetical protein
MSGEIQGDLTTRELLDRCIRAELRAHILGRQVAEYRSAVKMALRFKAMEKMRARLEVAIQADMTLILATPE